VGAFEIDLRLSIGAMQSSSASGEAPCAEEYMDSHPTAQPRRIHRLFLNPEQETPLASA
jgi:hypothetical protein